MGIIVTLLGEYGIISVIGIAVFIFSYIKSIVIFDFVDKHTLGTRNDILEKLDFLFIKVNPDHITYILLFLSFGLSIITVGIFGLISLWGFGAFLGALIFIIGWKIPKPFINYLVKRRIKAYQEQMIDALTLLSNGIRAGLSLPQSIGMVVNEMPAPISQEFNILLQQNRIGVPLEECFENLAKRLPLEDNDIFVAAINILRESGGNLAETFDIIVEIIRERIRLQQKIDTYVAQGLIQGSILFAMPFGLAIMFFIMDPENMKKLFLEPIGILLLFIALGFNLLGGFVILKIVNIRV